MLNLVKTTNLMTKRMPLICGLLFAAVLALLPISAGAQCKNWDASGKLIIIQQGQDYRISLTLEQKGSVITGGARQDISGSSVSGYGDKLTATVDGTIDRNSFRVQLFWNNQQTGVYIAKVLPSGRLDGQGYEKRSPNVRVPWHSLGVLKCAPPPPIKESGEANPPPPKPIRSSGKARVEPAPPPMKVPGIVASHTIIVPISLTGSVVLTWDGGPDHPYAEVWCKIDGGDEFFVVEQGKGSMQVTVQRGRNYEYILTDAGTTLAKVVFSVPPL